MTGQSGHALPLRYRRLKARSGHGLPSWVCFSTAAKGNTSVAEPWRQRNYWFATAAAVATYFV